MSTEPPPGWRPAAASRLPPPSGVKNADEGELKAVASEDAHVYNVADFNVMADIVDVLTRTVCERTETLHKQMAGQPVTPDP